MKERTKKTQQNGRIQKLKNKDKYKININKIA